MHVLTVIGARPQFVKAAAVSRAFKRFNESTESPIVETIVHTGQHYDANMSDIFFSEMGIPAPDHQLAIGGVSHGAMTGRLLEQIETLLMDLSPDAVMVYGDTNSTLAGAMAASKLPTKLIHVESGLRSYNRLMPEEINRVATDHISDVLFCPTETAVRNLKTEGIVTDEIRQVHMVGDVMYDAALHYSKESEDKSDLLERIQMTDRPFILCTLHRAENTNDTQRLERILEALATLNATIPIVLPLHPRTAKATDEAGLSLLLSELTTIPPVGYFDMLGLIKGCSLVATDSGGLQKEAFFFQKPCVTMRTETEWIELVESGVNVLAGDPAQIVGASQDMLNLDFPQDLTLYGNGDASDKIAQAISALA